jgi:hypothetical protein
VALVTGASSGIGAALARRLCERGHDAVLVARRRDRLEDLAGELRERHGRRVEIISCDLSDAEARATLPEQIEHLGVEVDVLILAAGFGIVGPFVSQSRERITEMVRTNVEAVMALSHDLIPPMAARGSGAVLIVSSLAGNQPMPNLGAYGATKAAMTSFAQALHCELAASGVTVTALCPGAVRTEFAHVAGGLAAERRTPNMLIIDADECARAGLAGLHRGKRQVIPRRAVQLFTWLGGHAPRAVWLPMCRRLLAP